MIYADYEYYAGVYMGTVNEEEFQRLALRASSFLDYYTRNQAKDNAGLDEVRMCCCALVDKYKIIEAANDLAAQRLANAAGNAVETRSETAGSWSRTLVSGSESALAALNTSDGAKKMLADTCCEYLSGTGLLYRGGCRCMHRTP